MLHLSDLNHQENSEKNQPSSREKFFTPFDNIIPSLLLEEKGVKGNHIRLYGLIRSLSQKYGYCFAANERLAATLGCGKRNTQLLLSWLEEKRFIERREEGDEFNPERHIYLLDPRQKILTRGVKVAFTGGRRLPSPKEEEQNKNKKKENTKKKDETPANAVALASIFFNKIKEKKPNFTKKITPKWYLIMAKLLSLRPEKEIMEVMDFAFKDEFYSRLMLEPDRLLRHLDALEMKMQNPMKNSTTISKENHEWLEKIRNKICNHADIAITNEGIVFSGGQSQIFVKIADANFKKLVIERLKLMKIKIE